jgi:malate dehydrogenase (oxaloacetate-decarboxylating)(NADP+)
VGRPEVLLARIENLACACVWARTWKSPTRNTTNAPPVLDQLLGTDARNGVTKEMARVETRRRLTLIGAMMVRLGDADGMICGTVGGYQDHLHFVDQVIGKKPGSDTYAAMNILLLEKQTVALVDPRQRQPHGRADCRIHRPPPRK